jgi:DNA repair exonuclease SbcCD ATPase subunit
MLKRIRVRDIQSLADVDLELGQVTVIVGPSRSGKSALVRSLRACLFNWTPGPRFVRAGATSGEVTLDFEEASVTWEKPAKGGASYRLRTAEGEQLLTRLGRELPPNVAELTGIRELQVDGVRIRPNFDCQHDEPFLLASTGGQAAKLLAHVSKMDDVVRAQVEAKRDRDRTERLATDAESRAETVRTELGAMPDYPALLTRWEGLQERHRAAKQAEEGLDAARVASGRLRRLLALRAGWKDATLPDRMAALTGRADALVRATGVIAARVGVAARQEGMCRQLAEARQRLDASEKQLHSVLDSLEMCPICERSMR